MTEQELRRFMETLRGTPRPKAETIGIVCAALGCTEAQAAAAWDSVFCPDAERRQVDVGEARRRDWLKAGEGEPARRGGPPESTLCGRRW